MAHRSVDAFVYYQPGRVTDPPLRIVMVFIKGKLRTRFVFCQHRSVPVNRDALCLFNRVRGNIPGPLLWIPLPRKGQNDGDGSADV